MALPTSKVYLDSAGVLREGNFDQASLDAQLAGKLDVSALANYLAGKVDTTALQTALDAKASATELTSLATKVNNPITKYVGDGSAMTLAALMSDYPANAARMGMYARVSDLYGAVDDIMRCRYDGAAYRWVPQREAFSGINTATSGTINILPLFTPPSLRFTATLTGNVTTQFSTVNAYLGQRQRIIANGVLGLFGFTVGGLIGTNVSLLTGGVKDFEYGPSGWFLAS